MRWYRGERIVTVDDNYDNLGYHADDVTRDARYTRYLDDRRMLRSHSSALVPGALRALAADPAADVLLVCPGLVYRRDAVDRLRLGARPGQKNVLLKVVLRRLDRTLTDHDANLLRDRIYAAVHRGAARQWAAGR